MKIKTKYNIGDIVWFQSFGQEISGEVTALSFRVSKGSKSYTMYSIDNTYTLEEDKLFTDLNELLDAIEEEEYDNT